MAISGLFLKFAYSRKFPITTWSKWLSCRGKNGGRRCDEVVHKTHHGWRLQPWRRPCSVAAGRSVALCLGLGNSVVGGWCWLRLVIIHITYIYIHITQIYIYIHIYIYVICFETISLTIVNDGRIIKHHCDDDWYYHYFYSHGYSIISTAALVTWCTWWSLRDA